MVCMSFFRPPLSPCCCFSTSSSLPCCMGDVGVAGPCCGVTPCGLLGLLPDLVSAYALCWSPRARWAGPHASSYASRALGRDPDISVTRNWGKLGYDGIRLGDDGASPGILS